ncbi:MAG: GMP synthase [Brevundimonas subvibrioides]|uniref:GMP synthase n=1 Tax=Brevundimonas subvibrioides TaxID=74313 RepID=A0A258HE81_9CAUL|nr:type 1 glutamine amidotransferase [Brevundimonas subvibrioides]OYX54927.1 MAG: GMP synthase [Brevundimonas subvibrioides]
MKPIAILETGKPPEALKDAFDDYPARFRALLGEGVATVRFDVQAGRLPEDPEDFQGAIVTGSAAGVYDDLPWIAPLVDWLRAARGRTRLVGICFGHQVMAHAFGGLVEKSDKGWGVGLHRYAVVGEEPWMFPRAASIAIPVSHQDQVLVPPADARVIAASEFTPFAGLAWDDAMSFQCHPEFQPDYAAALVESRRGHRIADALADEALASLAKSNDRAVLTAWIRAFLMLTPPPVEGEGSGI